MRRVLPILFNTDMVRVILDDKKTVTRRVVKKSQCTFFTKKEPSDLQKKDLYYPYDTMSDTELIASTYRYPYKPGDILYVRETWQYIDFAGQENGYVYKASPNGKEWEENSEGWTWRPSIHMPKEAARIWLEVTDVRVERLKDISGQGLIDEGIISSIELSQGMMRDKFIIFKSIWNSTIKKPDLDMYGWDANPWVWVIEFERCEKPDENKCQG